MTHGIGGEDEVLAPVIPLFPGQSPQASGAPQSESTWHASWVEDEREHSYEVDPAAAEQALLKKLRTRSLSVREARSAIRDHDLGEADSDALIERFVSRGYLDDQALAEQLVAKARDRKAQGRQAIAMSLSQRGIPRDVVDAALDEMPDDEHERAMEFARSKARQLAGVDRDTALRRLAGQLSRRGFGGVSLSVARKALDERDDPRRRVRFE